MANAKLAGPHAASLKYDVLTALGALALSEGKARQRLILRLMTLITARYNWTHDRLAIGQREIARLWSVDERTVKREMAKLRATGWLVQSRAACRGRVAEYQLGLDQILTDTRCRWSDIGIDFDQRLSTPQVPDNVVPLSPRGQTGPAPVQDGSEWAVACGVLNGEDPASYQAWVSGLRREGRDGRRLTVQAPSRFHASYVMTHLHTRLLRILQSVDPDLQDLVVIA